MAGMQELRKFVDFTTKLKGDEKSEATHFVDRLMMAFGHKGSIEAGGEHESRIKFQSTTKFADYLWPERVLIEMKKRGEKLAKHYQQAFDYWLELVPRRPAYVILCNFDEIWIYDFNKQLREPVETLIVSELTEKENWKSLRFLYEKEQQPEFSNDRVKVTREAASLIADTYNSMIDLGRKPTIDPAIAERYVLQCLIALFSEDAELLPAKLFSNLLAESRKPNHDEAKTLTFDLIGGLFRQMNSAQPAAGGRYKGVEYFNGGLFSKVEAIELTWGELTNLHKAAHAFDWSQVEPDIFGSIFQKSMGEKARHAYGAHYTWPVDIMKVVGPTIVKPWLEKITEAESTKKITELIELHKALTRYRVLDPACGSGNFLYVAFKELKALERRLIRSMLDVDHSAAKTYFQNASFVSVKQLYGIDVLPFAVELAKVTLMLAKEMAIMKPEGDDDEVEGIIRDVENALPLDNLDANIFISDAILEPWPEADAIIGNPPYQSKNKMLKEFGASRLEEIRAAHPSIPGRADFCVYWLKIAHDSLKDGGRAGLVGTNTIRQNFSREGGLDYIVNNKGTIVDAIGTQPWSGEAAVHVSIVNWVKGYQAGKKLLQIQTGDDLKGPVHRFELDEIGPSLTSGTDVSSAQRLRANMDSRACYQGQTHGHKGFLLTADDAEVLLRREPNHAEVVFPYLTADEMLDFVPGKPSARRKRSHPFDQTSLFSPKSLAPNQSTLGLPRDTKSEEGKAGDGPVWYPERYVIDFADRDMLEAEAFTSAFNQVRDQVLVDVQKKADEEKAESGSGGPRQSHLQHWWHHWRRRPDLASRLQKVSRYITCGRVTKRPIFEFVSSKIRPNDALAVFPLEDDYSFGILQS